MPAKRLNYIPGLMNNTNLPTPNAFTEPITGLAIPGSGLVLGDIMTITPKEAQMLSTQPGMPSPFPLYEGDYQFVGVDAAATAANVARGRIAFLLSVARGNLVVTDGSHALNVNLVTGIFINSITPGNYGWIQIAGRANVMFAAAGGAPGDGVVAVAATGTGLISAAASFTGPNVLNWIGTLLTPAAVANSTGVVRLKLISAQQ